MDLDRWIEQVKRVEYLPENDLKKLCEYVKELMLEESNVQPVYGPVTVCGDIHGQYHDLLHLFDTAGEVPSTNYIFMVRTAAPAMWMCHSGHTASTTARAGRLRRSWLQQLGSVHISSPFEGEVRPGTGLGAGHCSPF